MSSHKTEQAVLYKIYIEDKYNYQEVINLVAEHFDGANLTFGTGIWKGKKETALIIEIIADCTDKRNILKLAGDIKILNQQDSVLVFTSTGFINEI